MKPSKKRKQFVAPPPTDWAKLREMVVRAIELRDKLNAETDKLNAAIKRAATAIGALRFGVTGRVPIREDMLLVFTYGSAPEFTIQEDDGAGGIEYPLLQAPRSIRLHAVQFFPTIIKAMADECYKVSLLAGTRVEEADPLLVKLAALTRPSQTR